MTIHLPPHIESSIQAAVHSGRFASLDEAMTEAASLLVQRLNQEQAQVSPLDELHRQMLADGLISQLPNTAADIDDEQEEPVEIDGEPISETIIRERR